MQGYLLLAAVLGFPACTDDSLAPGAGDDPGTGTGTLKVTCGISASRANADFPTDFRVHLEKDGLPFDTADVTITSSSGAIKLVRETDRLGRPLSGAWVARASKYDEVYVLDVTTATDNVRGVRVDGPDIHTITSPVGQPTVDPRLPMTIEWSRREDAETAYLNFTDQDGNYPPLLLPDSGSYSLAPGTLRTSLDSLRFVSGSLVRDKLVTPTGGADGSMVWVVVSAYLGVFTDPNPL